MGIGSSNGKNFTVDDLYDDIVLKGYDTEILSVIKDFLENKEGKLTTKDEYYRVMVNTISNITNKLLTKYGTTVGDKEKFHRYMDEFIRHMFMEAGSNMKHKSKKLSEAKNSNMGKLKLLDLLVESDRLVNMGDITNLNLKKWGSKGLKPYYFNDDEMSDDFGMNPVTEIPEKDENNFKMDIFLLSDSDMEKIKKLTDNVKNIISLQREKIEMMKEYIKSVASEMGNNR